MSSSVPPKAQTILDYWFGDLASTPAYFKSRNKLWFMGGEKVDEHIRRNFEADVDRAARGELKDWEEHPRSCLALVVLLDQFSLNLYREQPRSYDQSRLAVPIVERALSRGFDRGVTPVEAVFYYLPLEHSELLAEQERSVALFEGLVARAPADQRAAMEGYLDFAVRHWRVVKRFGRFPDRNEVYGRESTPEEQVFLASDEAPF